MFNTNIIIIIAHIIIIVKYKYLGYPVLRHLGWVAQDWHMGGHGRMDRYQYWGTRATTGTRTVLGRQDVPSHRDCIQFFSIPSLPSPWCPGLGSPNWPIFDCLGAQP